ncbi:hypothetical protein DPMN_067591 [Dreissena polymorpha]|uniref:Uncharacterized protein n=1 Tax=Dreissena polymorpha TaxID=45954 RepID=A0A9D4BTN9_DREPO|nr:hypothetical protein DPMN_067591 [Dreissena polymorpha]
MILFQSSLVDLFEEKRPNERESQAYNNWTVEMMNAAQQRVGDAEIARDISACAVYLNVGVTCIDQAFSKHSCLESIL